MGNWGGKGVDGGFNTWDFMEGGVKALDKILPIPFLSHILLPPSIFYFIFLSFSLFPTHVLAITTLKFGYDVEGFISNVWVTEPTGTKLLGGYGGVVAVPCTATEHNLSPYI